MGAVRPIFLLEEKTMKLTTRRIAFAGILAALYAVLTIVEGLIAPGLAYGNIQFRFAEALAVLCCFTPAAIPGMVIGCVVANIYSSVGIWDTVIGSSATLLACLVTWFLSRGLRSQVSETLSGAERGEAERKSSLRKLLLVFLVPLPTILFNAVIVGAELAFFFPEDQAFWTAFGGYALSVGAGEAAVLYVLGVPLLIWLLKDCRLNRQLCTI